MKKIFAFLFLAPLLALADTGGNLELHNGASLGANAGNKLVLYTSDTDDIIVKTDDTTRLEIDGTTGVLSGASGGYVLISDIEAVSDLRIKLDSDPQRLITFGATSDTALTMTFGDGGATAAQAFSILGTTTDGTDDSVIYISPADSIDTGEGPHMIMGGNEASAAEASIQLKAGNDSNGRVQIFLNAANFFQVIGSSNSIPFSVSGAGKVAYNTANTDAPSYEGWTPYTITPAATPAADSIRPGYNIFPTAAANHGGALPASPSQGDMVDIVNTGPNSVSVYAGATDTINAGSANQRIVVPTLNRLRCVAQSASLWYCGLDAAPTPQA